MPPPLAALIFFAGMVGLYVIDRDEESRCSIAIWLPIAWLFIGASRSFSEWLAGGNGGQMYTTSAGQYLEGSPLDAVILAILLAMALAVLVSRIRTSNAFLKENAPLLLFLMYCLLSVLWSDFPLIAFKRWTKMLGNISMVLIVLTDKNPSAALKRFLSTTGFILIPLSILLIKYFPDYGRAYDRWTGSIVYIGAVGEKNGLGYDCLIFGLGAAWSFIGALVSKPFKFRRLIAPGVILGMVVYLLRLADSATSRTCLLLGSGLIFLVTFYVKQKKYRMHLIAGTLVTCATIALVFPDALAFVIHSVGRETNLTGRTDLWDELLQMHSNPIIGTGFESFFLGPRLELLWARHWWHPQEAHNGYLEIYLTLGWVGIGMLALLALSGYRRISASYRNDPHLGALRLALLFVALIYNGTEAAFKIMHPVLIMFLLAVVGIPATALQESQAREAAPVEPEGMFQPSLVNARKPALARNSTPLGPLAHRPSRMQRLDKDPFPKRP
jgi:exopolysaccharide production protein ExoQ